MKKNLSILIPILAIFLFSFSINYDKKYQDQRKSSTELIGQYRLNYTGKINKTSGWALERREELLNLKLDSTFILTRISQGGFEVLPDSGRWLYVNSAIVLETHITKIMIECDFKPSKRIFKIVPDGLIEVKGREKKFSKTLWKKE